MDRLRGSGDLAALADIVVLLSGKDLKSLTVEKHRHEALENAQNFGFRVDNPIGEAIKLIRFENKEKIKPVAQCSDDICDWLERNNPEKFTTAQIINLMNELGHAKHTVYSAINEIRERKIIKTGTKRGQFSYEMRKNG